MGTNISINEALQITAICMGIVFATLYIISLIIELFSVIKNVAEKKNKNNNSDEKAITSVKSETKREIKNLASEEEIAVAMAAAINMSNGNKNSRFRVVSFKQVG